MKERTTTTTEKYDNQGKLIEKITVVCEKETQDSQPYIVPWKSFETTPSYPWTSPTVTYGNGDTTAIPWTVYVTS